METAGLPLITARPTAISPFEEARLDSGRSPGDRRMIAVASVRLSVWEQIGSVSSSAGAYWIVVWPPASDRVLLYVTVQLADCPRYVKCQVTVLASVPAAVTVDDSSRPVPAAATADDGSRPIESPAPRRGMPTPTA